MITNLPVCDGLDRRRPDVCGESLGTDALLDIQKGLGQGKVHHVERGHVTLVHEHVRHPDGLRGVGIHQHEDFVRTESLGGLNHQTQQTDT